MTTDVPSIGSEGEKVKADSAGENEGPLALGLGS